MLINGVNNYRGKRVLLLQGPVGPFFRRLARDLTQAGAQLFKVNFNGGDWLFYPSRAFSFRGSLEQWPDYFELLLDQLNIDVVMLMGDCRPVHRVSREIADRRGLEVGVFEEGYVRPDYVTFERSGVNGHSLVPRTPIFYLNSSIPKTSAPAPVGKTFWYGMLWAMLYYFAAGLLKPFFRHYQHHRPLRWWEGTYWLRALWRKWYYAVKERGMTARLTNEHGGDYFLVPLQVHNDAQIHVHSHFDSVRHFIDDVMTSFARNAPQDALLVIKHHPMDRGYFDYSRVINEKVALLSLKGRCFYIHDQHLPTLLKQARGVVVVNSTVGLSALIHDTPVKACGDAIYDMKGLTFQGDLDRFWHHAREARPDAGLLKKFVAYLVQQTQLNGSFYKRLPLLGSAAGICWRECPSAGKGLGAGVAATAAADVEMAESLRTARLRVGRLAKALCDRR